MSIVLNQLPPEGAVSLQLGLGVASLLPAIGWLWWRGRFTGLRASHFGFTSKSLGQDIIWGIGGYIVALPLVYLASAVSNLAALLTPYSDSIAASNKARFEKLTAQKIASPVLYPGPCPVMPLGLLAGAPHGDGTGTTTEHFPGKMRARSAEVMAAMKEDSVRPPRLV